MKELDLHGLDHATAVDITENFLLLESSKGDSNPLEVKIITGNYFHLQWITITL